MAKAPQYALAILAAGQSRRFGPRDKLLASLAGRRLGEIACQSLAGLNLAHQWVIASRADHPCEPSWRAAGFQVAVNAQAASGIGSSVALAATLAKQANVDGLLIALADMPFVTSEHCRVLLDRAIGIGPAAIVASAADGIRLPPAVFGRDLLDSLTAITGDVGARALLHQADVLACAPGLLVDIDTEDGIKLAQAREIPGQ